MPIRTGFLFLLLGAVVLTAGAQTPENTLPRPVEDLPRYGFDRFTVQEGLPETFVIHLMQDPRGYLWAATQNGLARYDGQTLKTYLPSDGSFTMRTIESMATDSRGDLWVGGGFDGGLAHLDPATETWRFFHHDSTDRQTLSQNSVQAIANAGREKLLVVTSTLDLNAICLDRLDGTTGKVRRIRLAPDGTIGPEGMCFTIQQALLQFSERNVYARDETTGMTWISTEQGLLSYDPVVDTFTHFRPPELNLYADWLALESWMDGREPLAAIREVGREEDRTVPFEVTEATPVLLVGLGEVQRSVANDYGWIENAQGDTLWIMSEASSAWAGGAVRNRLVVATDTLPAGAYRLRYRSDQGHSFGEGFSGEPQHAAWWGTQVFSIASGDVVPALTPPFSRTESDPPASLTAIYADADGTVWVGTAEGLYQRDAQTGRFTRFEPHGDAAGFDTAGILTITEDRNGRVWVGSENGLYRVDDFEQGLVHHLRIPADETVLSLPLDDVASRRNIVLNIVEDAEGTLWLHTFGALIHLDPETEAMQIYEPDPDEPNGLGSGSMTAFFQDRQGTLWAGTRNGGLSRLNRAKTQFRHLESDVLGNSTVYSISEGMANDLWVGTEDGIQRLSLAAGRDHPSATLFTDQATHLYTDRSGRLWGAKSGAGLLLLNASGRVLASYRHDPSDSLSISDDNVNVILEDSQGRFWIGTGGGGLNQFDPERGVFTRYPYHTTPRAGTSDHLDDQTVFSVIEDSQGQLWIGTNLGGLSTFDPETGLFTSYFDESRGLVCIQSIYEDRAGRLWFGSYLGGLFQFDRATGEVVAHYDESNGLLHNDVEEIQEDDAGRLWLGTGRGLVRFDPQTEAFRTFHRVEGMTTQTFTRASLKLTDGPLLFGGDKGIIAFDPSVFGDNVVPPSIALERITHKSSGGDVRVPLGTQGTVQLAHNENDLTLSFVGIDFERPDAVRYRYQLTPYDTDWINGGDERQARYTSLSPGFYTFAVQAVNADGLWSEEARAGIRILPPWWKTWWAYMLYSLPLFAFGYSVVWAVQRQATQRERERSHQQLEQAYAQLDTSHRELKTTQQQLIQQEKMASLGQLTAGIAHEIKNPLNFVNNFAEVNEELADELDEALDAGETPESLKAIVADLRQNAQVIAQHGKRADGIVQSMMQHASGATGERTPTDVNALVSEHIDLAYHGKRAQVPDLQVEIKRDLSKETGSAKLVPREIGRVLLNLLGNAFDAVHEKMDAGTRGHGDAERGYRPTVTVSTRRNGEAVEIRIADNGPGIDKNLRQKIFEPFFTTKPTGSGTGLGLSLSYDIVTQGHGGTLTVESAEGEGATFIVALPPDSRM